MKTKEQYFKEQKEIAKKKAKERREKWRNEILEEIKDWDYEKLKEEYVTKYLARISYSGPLSSGLMWKYNHEDCRFCGLEYIYGHENCCDDCFEKNKHKTLEELDND